MPHAKFESSRPYSLGEDLGFFTKLPWHPEFFMDFNSLKYFEVYDIRIISVKLDD